MEQNTNTDNKIYISAFAGVLLFIAAMAFANLSIKTTELQYTITTALLGISSLSLLYKAIKNDPSKLKWKE